jgi:hypothetical protein
MEQSLKGAAALVLLGSCYIAVGVYQIRTGERLVGRLDFPPGQAKSTGIMMIVGGVCILLMTPLCFLEWCKPLD